MPTWKYSFVEQKYDVDRLAKASGRDLRISPKHSREICNVLKGMKVDKAKVFLEKVIEMKQSVPYRRFRRKVPHRKDLKEFKWCNGKYPQKAAARIYEILSSAESNAEFKGLDIDSCRIIHACAQRGRQIKRFIERAHGSSTAKYKTLSHVELVLYEFPS